MPLTPQQVAGHMGVSNNPVVSDAAHHASRQTILGSTSASDRPSVAGWLGVASNPIVSKSSQHKARSHILKAASGGGRGKTR